MCHSVPPAPPQFPQLCPLPTTIPQLLLNTTRIPLEIAALDGLWPPLSLWVSNMGHRFELLRMRQQSTFPLSSWLIARLLLPTVALDAEEVVSLLLGNISKMLGQLPIISIPILVLVPAATLLPSASLPFKLPAAWQLWPTASQLWD